MRMGAYQYKITYKADVDGLDPVQVEYTYDETDWLPEKMKFPAGELIYIVASFPGHG